MNFSARIDFEAPRNALDLERVALTASGLVPFDLSQSNPTKVGLGLEPEILASALAGQDNTHYYPDSRGLACARAAVAENISEGRAPAITLKTDRFILCASTSEAYSYLFKLLCNPGDSILIPRPGYPLFDQLAALESVKTIAYRLEYCHPKGWQIDTDSIARALDAPVGSKPKALVLINPNNPTGSYIHEEEARRIIELCAKHSVPIIADEVFFDFSLDPRPGKTSFLGLEDCLTFTLDGFSKRLCLPQMKLGWIYVSGPGKDALRAMEGLELIADSFLSAGTPVMNAARALLKHQKALQTSVRARSSEVLAIYRDVLEGEASPHRILACEGGWTALVQCPRFAGEEELAQGLLSQKGLYVHPGFFFDMETEVFFALSLIIRPEDARKAAEKFISYFNHFDT